jgi:hypothetical protein
VKYTPLCHAVKVPAYEKHDQAKEMVSLAKLQLSVEGRED